MQGHPATETLTTRATPATTVAAATATPWIRALGRPACLALLRRHVVGRMAHAFHDRVDITPIHYAYSSGWLFARTSHGAKMTTIAHSPWVAFEVDEVHGTFDWRSVVVHGTAYAMERDSGRTEAMLWKKGIEALRAVVPDTGTADDPVPFRDLVFGIHIDTIAGRIASPSPPRPAAHRARYRR